MKQAIRLVCAACLLVATGIAQANDPPSAAAPLIDFTMLDANKDGVLQPVEVVAVEDLQREFERLDRNTDGKLTPTEFSKWSRAGSVRDAMPSDPGTGPSGSSGSQHVPAVD